MITQKHWIDLHSQCRWRAGSSMLRSFSKESRILRIKRSNELLYYKNKWRSRMLKSAPSNLINELKVHLSLVDNTSEIPDNS
jgi:hypothetical protein